MLRAITLDYWDTLYHGASSPLRVQRRREALFRMVRALGADCDAEAFATVYTASAVEAERWWREEHRGYTTADRVHWMLRTLGLTVTPGHAEIRAAVAEVDASLAEHPPPLLDGAREALERLRGRFRLAVVSDTGFASGAAQDAVLARDGLRGHFVATVYSMDVGHAKPRPEPFRAALHALGVSPDEALHVGDIERTDVAGALGVGMRAVRLDAVRRSGGSAAEHVAASLQGLAAYLLD